MTSRPRRIAVLKPDFGVQGGFERVVEHVESALRADGHEVTRLTVDVNDLPHRPYGVAVPPDAWATEPEFFRYLASVEAFDRFDTRRYDAVVSTQPPSFTHRHPRHLALFFHHHRIFYDLEAPYLEAGLAADPAVHARASELVRRLDGPRLEQVSWFLAGSERVAERLADFNGRSNASVFHAGIGSGLDRSSPRPAASRPANGPVLCVGRHEFPKRSELVVQAAHLLAGPRFALVGTGGREPWARLLDRRLSERRCDATGLTDQELWLNTGRVPEGSATSTQPTSTPPTSNVEFCGRVDDDTLARLYTDAPCVVAPALDEDYGLTAIESMRHGRPVVVCKDGGGLTELVDDGVHGLVVDPTGPAIAAAVHRLTSDPDLADELGANGRARAATLTWKNADAELRAALDRVLA